MVSRRLLVPLSAFAILCSGSVFAQGGRGQAPADANARKLNDVQRREFLASNKLADDAMTGQAAPNDLSLSWVRSDVLKASDNKQFVPFAVSIDASKLTGGAAWVYWRVAPKGATIEVAPPPSKDDKDKGAKSAPPRVAYPFEDLGPVELAAGQPVTRITRSFTVVAGDYDVYVLVKEPTPEKPVKNAPPPKVALIKQTVTVPDFWNGELNTSSVIVAERIDPLPAPLSPAQQALRPYALGPIELVPTSETKFTKKAELQPFLLVYNPKTDAVTNKPDIMVEFNFFSKDPAGAEKPFNHTAPQILNASTLSPAFDLAAGHQLPAGQAVPLASFPEGSYRLEIKITDKIANKSITRDVNFSVSGS